MTKIGITQVEITDDEGPIYLDYCPKDDRFVILVNPGEPDEQYLDVTLPQMQMLTAVAEEIKRS